MVSMRNLMVAFVVALAVLFATGFIPVPGPGIMVVLARYTGDPEPPVDEVADFYVDANSGNDANDGLTPSTAWASIDYAIANATAGATIIFAAGEYGSLSQGDADAHGNGEYLFLRGSEAGVKPRLDSISLNYTTDTDAYLRLENFNVTSGTSATIVSLNNVRNFQLVESEVSASSYDNGGALVDGFSIQSSSDVLIESNRVSEVGRGITMQENSNVSIRGNYVSVKSGSGIESNSNNTNTLIEYNHIEGVDVELVSTQHMLLIGSGDLTVRGNVIHGLGTTTGVTFSSSAASNYSDIIIENNAIYDHRAPNVASRALGLYNLGTNVTIRGNLIGGFTRSDGSCPDGSSSSGITRYSTGIQVYSFASGADGTGVTIQDNILWGTSFLGTVDGNGVVDGNVFWTVGFDAYASGFDGEGDNRILLTSTGSCSYNTILETDGAFFVTAPDGLSNPGQWNPPSTGQEDFTLSTTGRSLFDSVRRDGQDPFDPIALLSVVGDDGFIEGFSVTPSPGNGFVTIANSDLAEYTSDVPTFYQVEAVDTSDWITYDATCECLLSAGVGEYQSGCYPTQPAQELMADANGNACTPATGTYAFPAEWNTTALLADGTATVGDAVTTDNAPRLRAMLADPDANWVDYLVHLPNGRYDIVDPGGLDNQFLWRPNGGTGSGNTYDATRIRHRRGIVGESQDAILTLYTGMVPPADIPDTSTYRGCTADTEDFGSGPVTGNLDGASPIVCTGFALGLRGIAGESLSSITGDDAVDWLDGFLPGAQVITVSDASLFSTTEYGRGSYARLRSWHTPTQSRAEREYVSPVVCIEVPPATPAGPDCSGMVNATGTHRIKIQHPLPAEFASAATQDATTSGRPGDLTDGPVVYPLSPAHEIVLRDFTMEYDNPHHGTQVLVDFRGMVRSEMSGMKLQKSGIQWALLNEGNADILIKSNDFVLNARDKSSNSYGFTAAGVSRLWFHDNFLRHQQPMVMGSKTFQALVTFNDFRGPLAACADGNNDGVCDIGEDPYTAANNPQVDNGDGRPSSQEVFDVDCGRVDPMAAWGARDGCADVDEDGFCDNDPSLAQAPGFTQDSNGGSTDIDCRVDPHVRLVDLDVSTGAHTGTPESGHLHYPRQSSIEVNQRMCTGANAPYSCCTGAGAGTCPGIYNHCANELFAGQTVENEGRYGDAWGLLGDPSCRGVPAGAIYGCVEWHNAASESTVFMRNFCEGVAWLDDNNGPGDSQFIYGNWFAGPGPEGDRYGKVSRTKTFNTAPSSDALGSLDASRMGQEGSSSQNYPTLLLRDWHYHNNVFEGDLGQDFGGSFDSYGSGTTVTDNVIGGNCYTTDDSGTTGCAEEPSPDRPVVNLIFADNTIGDDVHPGSYTRVMPSLPGFEDWPSFPSEPVGSPRPYVGPEMGDPDILEAPCLPASDRNNACQRDEIVLGVIPNPDPPPEPPPATSNPWACACDTWPTTNCTGTTISITMDDPLDGTENSGLALSAYGDAGEDTITYEFDQDVTYGCYANGFDVWAVEGGTPTSLTEIYPVEYTHATSLAQANMWFVDRTSRLEYFDSRYFLSDAADSPTFPYALNADGLGRPVSISKGISYTEAQVGTSCNDAPNSSSNGPCVKMATTLTILPSVPASNGETSLRPPLNGAVKPEYTLADIDFTRLPTLATTNINGLGTYSEVFKLCAGPQYDVSGRYGPNFNNPHYSTSQYATETAIREQSCIANTLFGSNHTHTSAETQILAINVIQRGLDIYYGMKSITDSRAFYANAGFGLGRLGPVAYAAALLNNDTTMEADLMARHTTIFSVGTASDAGDEFGEDGHVYRHPTTNLTLYGALDNGLTCAGKTQDMYISRNANSGARDCRDPLGWQDGGNVPGGSYQTCCTYGPFRGLAGIAYVFPAMRDIMLGTGDAGKKFFDYVERMNDQGIWVTPAVAWDAGGSDPRGYCVDGDGNNRYDTGEYYNSVDHPGVAHCLGEWLRSAARSRVTPPAEGEDGFLSWLPPTETGGWFQLQDKHQLYVEPANNETIGRSIFDEYKSCSRTTAIAATGQTEVTSFTVCP